MVLNLNEYVEYRTLYIHIAFIFSFIILNFGIITLTVSRLSKFNLERSKINPLYTKLGASMLCGKLSRIERAFIICMLCIISIIQIEIYSVQNTQLVEINHTETILNNTNVYEVTYYDYALDVEIKSYKLKEKNSK